MFRNQRIQKIIASVVLTTFSSLLSYPMTAAAQAHDAMDKAGLLRKQKDEGVVGNAQRYFAKLTTGKEQKPVYKTNAEERMSQLLGQIHEHLKAVNPVPHASLAASRESPTATPGSMLRAKATPQHASSTGLSESATTAHLTQMRAARSQMRELYADIAASFKETEQHIQDAKLPKEIMARHTAAVALYQSRQAQFDSLMDKVDQADIADIANVKQLQAASQLQSQQSQQRSVQTKAPANTGKQRPAALAELSQFMNQHQNAKPHQFTDPNKLPFGSPSNKIRKPNETKAQYQASLFPPKYDKIMLAGPIPDGLKLAQASLPALPAPQDTAETEDIQLTPAVKAQALALNNNPVQIYNWVHNNIAYIPSYGSIQGSELTLQNKRGNAFDTASLLIALYRAAGIPARYVYGTIDVPADKVMNWVGGVTKAEAAQSLLGQGGIPNTALTYAGKIQTIRMEHVWVEAYVDYFPSRGAVNKTPNTWVPVDASFKQYTFTQGMDIKGNVPLNSQDLLTQIQQGAIVNQAAGYVQNLNQANLQTQLSSYQTQVKTYIDSQKANATVGDVLGTQKIKPENYGILMGSLPYRIVATANSFQTLPDNLRWKFKTNLYAADGISTGENALIELNQSTAKLAGKKITLSFIPASPADQALINSYLPKAHADNTPIQPSELPTSLPGYLLNMKAEFRVDGQVVATTAGSFTMGSTVKQQNQYYIPGTGAWEGGDDNDITVGEYDAIGLDLQGMGAQQLKDLQDKMTVTKAKLAQFQLNPGDKSPLDGLTNEDLTGDFVQAGMLMYFTKVDASDSLAAFTVGNIVNYRLPSYGRLLTSAQPHFFFGIVRTVNFPGVMMDVDYLRYHAEAKDIDIAKRTNYMRQVGSAGSANEHAVPESMFRNPNLAISDPAQPQGISAVKALAIAASQGQKIYTLKPSNHASHSTILQSLQIGADVKLEIADALAAGKEVAVHEKDIAVNGWTGSGYIVLDPETGSGAYKIAGGANGGLLVAVGFFGFGLYWALLPLFALAPVVVLIGILLVLSIILLELTIAIAVEGSVSRAFLVNVAYGLLGAGLLLAFTPAVAAIGVWALVELSVMLALSYANAVHA